jgi:hypothetical protein
VKGAFVVSADRQFWERATDILIGRGASTTDGVIQLDDRSGYLFTLFREPEQTAEAVAEPLVAAPGLGQIPDLSDVEAYMAECRSEALFVDVVRDLAQAAHGTWVIDGDGVVWDAREVDASALRL